MEIDRLHAAAFTPVTPVRFHEEEHTSVVAAVRALNKSEFFGPERQAMFARDPDTHKPVIQIVDKNTGETVEQIPAAELLRILANVALEKKGDLNS